MRKTVDLGNATTDEVAQVARMNKEQIKELFLVISMRGKQFYE